MTPVERAKRYARDVLSGKIRAGLYVRLAVERFERDLKRKDWPYRFDEDRANRACEFMELMPHTKGKWAANKQTLFLQPWQCFIECNIFGWIRKDSGLRRFREAYEEEPRKNGKSIRLAARGLYLFAADGEAGAEVYSGATSEKQALEVFRPAWEMVRRMPGLRDRFGIEQAGNPKNPGPMFVMGDMSKFEPMIGKPGDGSSPHAALVDEYHEHETDHMVDAMQTGMGAREQPLLSIITTAGSNLGGPCYDKRRDVIRILEGQVVDETVFGIIYGLDDSEYTIIADTSLALKRLDQLCTCHSVPAEMAAQFLVKACATSATSEQGGRRGSKALKGVQTIPTAQQNAKDYAGLVTTETSGQEIQATPVVSPNDLPNGDGSTQSAGRRSKTAGGTNSQRKNWPIGLEAEPSKLFAECLSRNIKLFTDGKTETVPYAEGIEKLSALITATSPEDLEACFAGDAILRSAFLAMMQKVYLAHSNTCEGRKQRDREEGTSWSFKFYPDAWDDPASLIKANPNYGVSVFPDFLLAQLEAAKRSATKQNSFRTKHLDQWVGARTVWMNMLAWQRQKKVLTIEEFKGCPCWMAVDLASKKDVAALILLFQRDGQFFVIPKFYAPESAAEDNDKYQDFATDGCLTLTPGNMTDYAFIEQDILDLAKQVDLQSVAFDDWQANYLITRLQDTSIPVCDFNQTVRNMSEPMKEVEARTLSRTLWHDGNPMMTWMMGNVSAKIDAKENIYPRKDNENDPNCKIDGPVALIMAMGRALFGQEAEKTYTIAFLG